MKYIEPVSLLNKYRSQLMGFSALWILFFHCWRHIFADIGGVLYLAEMAAWRLGFHGVDIFMLLSGLGLSYAVEKYSTGEFLLRRLKRLVVPVLVIALIRALTENWGIVRFLQIIFGVNFYFGDSPYFFLWFITAIETLYILFPLYWKLFSSCKNKKLFMLVFICLWYGAALLLKGRIHTGVFGLINRIPVFTLGAYMGWLDKNGGIRVKKAPALFLAFALAAVGAVFSLLISFNFIHTTLPASNSCVPGIMIACGLGVLIPLLLGLLNNKNVLNRILAFIGGFSLELYCVQELLNTAVSSMELFSAVPAIIMNVIVFAGSIFCGWLLHIFSDKILKIMPKKRL